ncbi:thymidine kinase [Erythrobacter litoralis]|uniref:Thymidine kinase n=1 Tax=Erythrobacter litoralis (strain HTCC2594) TaxID=314225 RepID=Q2NC01_ERYLH|nr:thymidine kinase [Erythrobacter litoralis]ABC62790.1 thymidine kinase [Erythrobacter litoralis HTCC2594]
MAKLYFYYASMNAGKSSTLLQTAFNYGERGMKVSLWTAAIDDRPGFGAISSRIGLASDAHRFREDTDILEFVLREHAEGRVDCVLIDEAQFLTERQVWQCAQLADDANTPVICYGLRTDFQGKLFPGSAALLGIADKLVELKAICHCGRKATMNLRVDADGKPISEGAQTEIGGNDRYLALCRKHFSQALAD